MRAHRLLIVTLVAGGAPVGGRNRRSPSPATGRRRGPGEVDHAPESGPARRAVAGRKLHGAGRFRLPDATRWVDTPRGRRHHHLRRLTLRHRGEAQYPAAPFQITAARFGRSRVGAAMRVVGATAFPYIMAAGATAMSATPTRSAGSPQSRARRRHPREFRAGRGRPTTTRSIRSSTPVRSGRTPRPSRAFVRGYVRGLQDNGMLATLKHFRATRHGCGLAYRSARHSGQLRSARLCRARAVSCGHRSRRAGG